jgi:hypothetical protein
VLLPLRRFNTKACGHGFISVIANQDERVDLKSEYLIVIIARHAGILRQNGLWHLVSRTTHNTCFGALASRASCRGTFTAPILTYICGRLFSTARIFVRELRCALKTVAVMWYATY